MALGHNATDTEETDEMVLKPKLNKVPKNKQPCRSSNDAGHMNMKGVFLHVLSDALGEFYIPQQFINVAGSFGPYVSTTDYYINVADALLASLAQSKLTISLCLRVCYRLTQISLNRSLRNTYYMHTTQSNWWKLTVARYSKLPYPVNMQAKIRTVAEIRIIATVKIETSSFIAILNLMLD